MIASTWISWILLLQFLEVNGSAGYLLPILKDVVGDVWDFLIFHAVFQCGITCAFYRVLVGPNAYKSLWASFASTYFVMYGEIGMGELTKVDDESEEPLSRAEINFSYLLRMFQYAVMSILLLNLLLAMKNKTLCID
ncbi:hypothetical protein THRCLA_07840 [Thraustotheca clavata]|uniref:Ion transport domain-containing protein n=1 Tax=Thraustotheca clavata TaxID=74557 RepID=A0A1V9ZBS6_9STRA|nr:hypothetical protein THRCLA_07840 [Thraustotheca clavata]